MLSRVLNRIPGLNSTAGFHDMLMIRLELAGIPSIASNALLVPTILPSAAVSYGALLPGMPDGLERVDRLARLGDPQSEGVRVQHRVPVPELAGDLDLDRQACPVLDRVLGHEPGMERRSARHDEHLCDPEAHFVRPYLAFPDPPAPF